MRAFQHFHRGTIMAAALLVLSGLYTPTAAQQNDFTAVENPFQQEIEYEIGDDLRPGVEVDGVRWIRFAIRTRNDRQYPADKPVPVNVEIDLLNRADSADVLIIVLFEDENGTALDRLELDPIDAKQDRLREVVQKHKITAAVVEATRRIYLFLEVSR
jgi:hypothetical protein